MLGCAQSMFGRTTTCNSFGLGEARIELLKALGKHKLLHDRVKHVEQSDKMTEKQMIHHVKVFLKNIGLPVKGDKYSPTSLLNR